MASTLVRQVPHVVLMDWSLGVVGAGGYDDNDFPAAGRHGDAALVEGGHVAVGAGATAAVAAADDVDLIAGV
jgi:hypothetical protein